VRRALVLISSCALSLLVACGGGNNASSAGGNSITPPSSGSNVAPIVVDAGPAAIQATAPSTNSAFVTVTVCVPGTTTCQNIDHVLVDTGSEGLRVLASVMTLPLATQTNSSGQLIAECVPFLDQTFVWGPIQTADIQIAGEKASSAPIQVIGESQIPLPTTPGTTTSACVGTDDDSVQTLAANGILGIGPFLQDCGALCVTGIPSPQPLYFACSASGGTSCLPTTQPLASQATNPVAMFATDNNGTIIELPGISNNGATTVTGSLVFGIGTQSNNALKGATPLATDANGNIGAAFNGNQYTAFLDSGTNILGILDAVTLGIPACTDNADFYCPGSPNTGALNLRNLTATNFDSVGDQSTVNFGIANADFLFSSNGGANFAFNNLGGPNSGMFDWGLPFFYGRNVFTAIENQNTPIGAGPFFAY
jgi:Protein of unknown function (DUF3443)